MILLLLACAGSPTPEDPLARYAALAGHADPAACASVGDPSLAAECVSMAASELAARGEQEAARAACAQITDPFWSQECWFLLADTVGARGALAGELCKASGRLRNACITHAVDRETAESLHELIPGEEAAFEALLTERLATFLPASRAARAARQVLAAELAHRDAGADFSPATCGGALPETCVDAYVARVEEAISHNLCQGAQVPDCGGTVLAPHCGEGRNVDTVRAAGLPGWVPESAAVVELAWARLCDPKAPALSQGVRGR